MITETIDSRTTFKTEAVNIPDDPMIRVIDDMTLVNQSRKDVYKPMIVHTTSLTNPKEEIHIGCWNVRTMYDIGKAAQVAREMNNYNCTILGLSEVRWTGFGKVKLTSGETIIFSGREDNLHREGVALMMSRIAEKALMEWKPVSERIITARFFSKYIKTTVIQVYAPTEDSQEEDKDAFYDQLQAVLSAVPKHDVKIVMGDFNAKTGQQNKGHEESMGRHGLGVMNDNGERMINLCEMFNLVVTGTVFPHKNIHKATWKSPDGRTKNQIDHILISRQHRSSMLDIRAMRAADVGSDHYLVRGRIRLKLKAKRAIQPARRRFKTETLADSKTKAKFINTVTSKLNNSKKTASCGDEERTAQEVEAKWKKVKDSYIQAAEEVLGYRDTKRKPWISNESWTVIEQRKVIKVRIEHTKSERLKNNLQTEYRATDKKVKKMIRNDKRKWIDKKCEEAEEAANMGRIKQTYNIVNSVCNVRGKVCQAVKSKTGELITDEKQRLERWKEHFDEILNRPAPEHPIEHLDNTGIELEEISIGHITKDEIKKALKQMQNGKAGGTDGITAELLKADMEITATILEDLFLTIWDNDLVPKEWKQGIIVKIPKKGDLSVCDNYRGITLLSTPSKVFARVLINRIYDGVDAKLRKEQAGFRRGRGTTEQIFVLRNIIEQSIEWNATVYVNFVDFEKAFDSVHQDSLWKIMKTYGIPDKIIKMVQLLYEDNECTVADSGQQSEWFRIKTGVKQGCCMSGFLFLLVIDWIMRTVLADTPTGIRWKMMSKLEDLDFADDIALLSSTHEHMQQKTTKLYNTAKQIGLIINKKKTKVMKINNKNQTAITIDNEEVESVERFSYLGACVSRTGGSDEDIKLRIGKARAVFKKLGKVWRASQFSSRTKIKMFNSLVKPVLLYGSETWKMNEGDNRLVDTFMFRCMRYILKIFWPYVVSNEEILQRTKSVQLSREIQARRWRWIGHVLRMEHESHSVTALTWQPEGKRSRGRPKTTWRRTVEQERNQLGWQSWNEARRVAAERTEWRRRVMALYATGHEEDR